MRLPEVGRPSLYQGSDWGIQNIPMAGVMVVELDLMGETMSRARVLSQA